MCSQRFDLLRDIQCGSWSDMKYTTLKIIHLQTRIAPTKRAWYYSIAAIRTACISTYNLNLYRIYINLMLYFIRKSLLERYVTRASQTIVYIERALKNATLSIIVQRVQSLRAHAFVISYICAHKCSISERE